MIVVGLVLVAVAPGLFWLWFFLRKDAYGPAPRQLIAATFVLGCVATIPAAIIEYVVLGESFLEESAGLGGLAAGMLLIVGPVEEACKFAVVRLKAYRSSYFDEPVDGLVYAASASLGFASVENLIYVLELGPEVMILRAPVSTVAHLVFGSIWGYALGLHQQSGYRRHVLVGTCLALGACTHAIFNMLAYAPLPLPLAAVALTVGGAIWVLRRFEWAQKVSPFRYRRNYPETACPSCGQLIRVMSQFCRFCGTPVVGKVESLFCGHCGAGNSSLAAYCTGCGDRLLRTG